jgi:hypothetical protein
VSLDSDDLSCHYAPHLLCQWDVPSRQGVVPSELGYGYFCGNVVGEDDAWVSEHGALFLSKLSIVGNDL